ncbi:hereditary hemochromatosis protein homolog [Cebus imitator]|uniref:hereditary hemochromatosis protein homolog n=1 Tax=Cebus imitator TaxID=2715852 RepID=UPI001897C940|nr:hereditary hemochromatosis protein homolog [Cebus imitator]
MSAGLVARELQLSEKHYPRWPALLHALVLLLCLLETARSGSQATTHCLRYDFIALSQPSCGQTPYEVSGYLDDQPFLWCCKEGRWAEHCTSWAQARDPRAWAKLVLRLKARAQHFVSILRSIMAHNNQSQESHTLQTTVVYELLGNRSSWGHWHYNYDGQDFLLSTLESFNASKSQPEPSRAAEREKGREQSFLTQSCIYPLRKYLEAGVGPWPTVGVIEPPHIKHPPVWIFCGLLASVVVAVGAAGAFLWKKWRKGRTAGMLCMLELEAALNITGHLSLCETEV